MKIQVFVQKTGSWRSNKLSKQLNRVLVPPSTCPQCPQTIMSLTSRQLACGSARRRRRGGKPTPSFDHVVLDQIFRIRPAALDFTRFSCQEPRRLKWPVLSKRPRRGGQFNRKSCEIKSDLSSQSSNREGSLNEPGVLVRREAAGY